MVDGREQLPERQVGAVHPAVAVRGKILGQQRGEQIQRAGIQQARPLVAVDEAVALENGNGLAQRTGALDLGDRLKGIVRLQQLARRGVLARFGGPTRLLDHFGFIHDQTRFNRMTREIVAGSRPEPATYGAQSAGSVKDVATWNRP